MMRMIRRQQRSQQGVSMLLALIALMVLSLGSVAMIRSIETGTLIVGNMGFKQDATEASASGAEAAMTWLESHLTDGMLDANQVTDGYYAASLDKLDPTGSATTEAKPLALVNWDGNCQDTKAGTYTNCNTLPVTGTAVNGNQIQWVITRLCDLAAAPNASNLCLRPVTVTTSSASDRGSLSAGGRISGSVASPYYRIIVRATGPRNTVSVTETIVHF